MIEIFGMDIASPMFLLIIGAFIFFSTLFAGIVSRLTSSSDDDPNDPDYEEEETEKPSEFEDTTMKEAVSFDRQKFTRYLAHCQDEDEDDSDDTDSKIKLWDFHNGQ